MHPRLLDRRWLVLHLLTWIAAGVAVGVFVRTVLGMSWLPAMAFGVPMGLFGGPISLSGWYVARSIANGRSGPGRASVTASVSAAVGAAIWALVGQAWWRALDWLGVPMGEAERPGFYPLLLGTGALGYLRALAAYQVLHSFETAAVAARRALESEVAQRDAELRALRAQVDPHFLFNSLNSIAGLIGSSPDQAREMCQRLGEFLRDSLRIGAGPAIPLSREVALVEQYMAIEQIRFGDRLRVRVELAPDTGETRVPPLLLQPLVENAVRHGIATTIEGGEVVVAARRAGPRVVVTITNPRDADARRAGTRLGLDIVRRRLSAAFGEQASLTIEPRPDGFQASVTIPAEEVA